MADKVGPKLAAQLALGPSGAARQLVRDASHRSFTGGSINDTTRGETDVLPNTSNRRIAELIAENAALVAEVKRLKKELVSRLQASTSGLASTEASTASTEASTDVDAERRRLKTERQQRWRQMAKRRSE
jgi:hypothetical protein